MDEAALVALARKGELLFMFKLVVTSAHFLWIYDYLLTLGDEIKYAWCGKRSWVFVLFIANRYSPVMYLILVTIAFFGYGESFCQATEWVPVFQATVAAVLAQIVIGLRIYAITGGNKLFGAPLLVLISAQLCFGVYFVVKAATHPPQQLPEINLDVFKICFFKRWHLGELLFTNLVMAFDLLAFLIIFATVKRPGTNRFPGIPTILDTLFRHATLYFILMFVCQFINELFLLFAPEEIQLMPGVANTVFVPVMVSRLMLSLKKATTEPSVPWSLSTMTNFGSETISEPLTVHFSSRARNGSQGSLEPPIPPNEGDIGLEPVSLDYR